MNCMLAVDFQNAGVSWNLQELLGGILVLEAMVLLLATKFSDAVLITTVWYVVYLMDSFEKAHAVDVDQTVICIRSLFVISSIFLCMYLLTLQSLVALH